MADKEITQFANPDSPLVTTYIGSTRVNPVLWEPTTKDYIQDGLIAMWDGIENAGWKNHDSNATVWKDLSENNNTLTLLNNAKFNDNSLITANRNMLTASIDKKLPYITIEVCAFQDTSRNSSALVCFGNSINSNWMFTVGWLELQTETPGYDLIFTTKLDNSIPHTWCGICNANRGEREYVDGKHISGTYRSNSWSSNRTFGLSGGIGYSAWNFVGNYYCVRLYSRALSPAEIAHNYKIDKIRFGL